MTDTTNQTESWRMRHQPEQLRTHTFYGQELLCYQKFDRLGGVIWDCAMVLAYFLEKNYEAKSWQGKCVVELGAGTGSHLCECLYILIQLPVACLSGVKCACL